MNRPTSSHPPAPAPRGPRARPTLRYERARFPWRFGLYAAVILYLFVDLYWLGGPLARRLLPDAADQARSHGWVARVYGRPITRAELDLAVEAHLFRSGRIPDDLAALTVDDALGLRLRILDALIEDRILALWARDDANLEIDETDVDRDLADLRSGFESDEAFDASLAAQGLNEASLRRRLRDHHRGLAWIENAIADAVTVTDEEVAAFHAAHAEDLANPDSLRARHLFLQATDASTGRESEIRALHRRLVEDREPFATLAAEASEDARSAALGGDLGWFSRHRMPEEFVAAVEHLETGTVSTPFRTSMGWHIAEVTDRRAARALTLEELAPEIRAHLAAEKRAAAVATLEEQLRARAARHIEYFYDNLTP